jgi:hypothetical protein
MLPSGYNAVWSVKSTNVSEEHVAYIFTVEYTEQHNIVKSVSHLLTRHDIKTYSGVEVQLHLLTSVPEGNEWSDIPQESCLGMH